MNYFKKKLDREKDIGKALLSEQFLSKIFPGYF